MSISKATLASADQRTSNVETAINRLRQSTGDHVGKGAFVARALNALARVAAEMDERSLTTAAGAPSDYDVLLQVLEEAESLALLADDPLAAARLRGLRSRERLLMAEGGTISAPQVAALLGLSRQAVDKRRRAGRLIGLSTGKRGYAYPAWQFDPQSGVLAGLEATLSELREHDEWMQVVFMLNPNAALDGKTPLDALRRGAVESVKRAARLYGEHGAA